MAELQPPPLEAQSNGGVPPLASSDAVVTKRQRRPSVRLGDIGDQPTTLSYDSLARRTKHWHDYKLKKETATSGKGSKTRNLLNLGAGGEFQETLEGGEDKDGNCDGVAIGSWKMKDSKPRRGSAKRVRSNWASMVDEGGEGADNGYRDREFEPEGSDSHLKEQSPIHSLDDMAVDPRRPFRPRVLEGKDPDGVELEGPSDTDVRDWRCGASADMNANGGRGRCPSSEDGVRIWLDGLGLGRYAAVFEIHEVDDEVLPMLTLEDLKDMGINAVGSRRKMFCAIQKLGKGFS